ncbi:MAG: hypothetical protein HY301_10370 [Verrucomicrobia bacterium]|nr:hypothetical protein [Verrucomicrobiota bacterium]
MKRTTLLSFATPAALAVIFTTASPALAAETFTAGQFTFATPKGWKKLESSSAMRAAELKAGEAKDAPDVVFYYFGPGGAGGTKANVDRWLSQFVEPRDDKNTKTEEKTVGKVKVTYVQAEGTYQSGMPGGPKTPMPNSLLLGAIVEGSEGSVFARMTGPAALTKAAAADFKKMIEGALK